ncbi:MAG: ATP-binding protein, partial [Ignavibacteria bacterium]|nr:ATP-binding protein [Ignavibacteria bacterium]
TDVTRQRKMYFDQKDSKVNSYERRLQCKDGTNIWALITVSPILSKTGVYQGAFGMFADITEQKKMIYELVSAKEKAEEMNNVKSSFFANMSHELRTPFVGIIGFAEIIKENTTDREIAQMADGIVQSSKRMTNTLNNILDLTKLEYGNLELYFEHVNVEGLIDEVYHSFLNDAVSKGIVFEKRVSGFTTPVNSDRSLLRSILTGLVSNAVKYTRQGKIEILADRRINGEQEFLVIQISDTGIGIANETQVIIWNEFRQASEGLNRNFEGTGLGLTLCKKYVELLNGKIYLQSQVGVGSTFTAEIPVTSADYETDNGLTISDAHENIPLEYAETLPNKKVLYIDDDPLSLDVVGRYLSHEFSVECVSRVPQFLEKLKEDTFDCILMDINLGGEISGINLITEVKQIEKYYNTPVVAITAYALKSDEELILSKGFSHYISKPFEKNYILNLLKRIFAEK